MITLTTSSFRAIIYSLFLATLTSSTSSDAFVFCSAYKGHAISGTPFTMLSRFEPVEPMKEPVSLFPLLGPRILMAMDRFDCAVALWMQNYCDSVNGGQIHKLQFMAELVSSAVVTLSERGKGGSYTNQGDDLSHGKRHEEVIWRLLQIPKDIVCQVKAIELTNEGSSPSVNF
ncbi:hypothetical protein F2Q69_00027298 [Brassica cretica]|uniref:Uncharacterized protein n=1 Tax=Brassica cretica TaxID=69181 RepID=A0A8S9S294_BRACR|nr:hypothetical protein F2Q69_00027298 [Brassica cretica]